MEFSFLLPLVARTLYFRLVTSDRFIKKCLLSTKLKIYIPQGFEVLVSGSQVPLLYKGELVTNGPLLVDRLNIFKIQRFDPV